MYTQMTLWLRGHRAFAPPTRCTLLSNHLVLPVMFVNRSVADTLHVWRDMWRNCWSDSQGMLWSAHVSSLPEELCLWSLNTFNQLKSHWQEKNQTLHSHRCLPTADRQPEVPGPSHSIYNTGLLLVNLRLDKHVTRQSIYPTNWTESWISMTCLYQRS